MNYYHSFLSFITVFALSLWNSLIPMSQTRDRINCLHSPSMAKCMTCDKFSLSESWAQKTCSVQLTESYFHARLHLFGMYAWILYWRVKTRRRNSGWEMDWDAAGIHRLHFFRVFFFLRTVPCPHTRSTLLPSVLLCYTYVWTFLSVYLQKKKIIIN